LPELDQAGAVIGDAGDILSRSPAPLEANNAAGFANNFSEQGEQPVLN
jgi:hypothetical protein